MSRLSAAQARMLEANAARTWEAFYKANGNRFFKDRHWLAKEFTEELGTEGRTPEVLVEMGCGCGNTVYPLLEMFPEALVHCCDYAQNAVGLVKKHERYDEKSVNAFVCDISKDDAVEKGAPRLAEHVADIVLLVFALSALSPETHSHALTQAHRALKPSCGVLLFRDYADGDLAMERQAGKKGAAGIREISERFYMRGDGTRAYYFQRDEFRALLESHGFRVLSCDYVEVALENRAQDIVMPRRFLQARARAL